MRFRKAMEQDHRLAVLRPGDSDVQLDAGGQWNPAELGHG
jgi:hypothetical protein